MNSDNVNDPIGAARSLVPFLSEMAPETEAARHLPDSVYRKIDEAGLFHLMTPPALGGSGPDLSTHIETATVLAEGCGSAAWVMCLVGYQNYLLGWYPPEVQQQIRDSGARIFTGLVMGPPVTAEIVEGGCRISGRWPYVSGAHYAGWFLLSARDPNQKGRVITCLVSASDARIEDDWFAMGLKGTGSVTVTLDDCFVPEDRILCFREAEKGGVPGAALCDSPLYRGIPTSTLFALVVAAPALGLAQAAIDAYSDRLRTRTNARMPSSQTEWPSSQARLGRAQARLAHTRRVFLESARRYERMAADGAEFTLEARSEFRMDAVEAVRTCTEIVYDLFCDAGTGATLDGSVLQRVFRDIHTLRSHFMIMPDAASENAGRIRLGLAPKPPFQAG